MIRSWFVIVLFVRVIAAHSTWILESCYLGTLPVGGILQAHVETQIAPLFSHFLQSEVSAVSLTTLAVAIKMHCSEAKKTRFLNSENERSVIMVITWFTLPGYDVTSTQWTGRFSVGAERPVSDWPRLNIFQVCMQLLDTYMTRRDRTWFAK